MVNFVLDFFHRFPFLYNSCVCPSIALQKVYLESVQDAGEY